MRTIRSGFAYRALLVAGGGLVLAALLAQTNFYNRLEWWSEDAQQRLVSDPLPLRNTLTVDIDEESMALLEPALGPWPYARDVYASAARYLLDAGARTITFDILFSEARRGDQAFAREIGQSVVLAAAALPQALVRSTGYHEQLKSLALQIAPPVPARTWDDLTLPRVPFTATGARPGVISFSPDADGTLRRATLLHSAYGNVLPGLALATLATADGGAIAVDGGAVHIGVRSWPVDARGEVALRFPASMEEMQVVPFHALARAIADPAALPELRERVRNRIVFVGSSSAVLGDFVYTPAGRLPGLYANALITELLLEGRVMQPPRIAIDLALLFVALAIPVAMIRRESALRPSAYLALTAAAVLAAAGLGIALNAFGQQSNWVFASLSAFTSGLLALMARIFVLHEERQRLYYEARAANEASRLKTEFLNRMTHELRTPITAISGFNKINRITDNLGREARINNSDIIARNCDHMLALINNNLDIARIEAGAVTIECKAEDAGALFSDTVAGLRSLAQEKGIGLELTWKSAVPEFLQLDALRTRQVLINLLSNAIKFTDRGAVALEVSWHDGVLFFRVRDSGGGIPPEVRERLFTPFQRVAGSRKPGTGLGLAITKHLVDLMSGSIGVESTPGVGATFHVRLPAPSADQERPAIAALPESPAPARLKGRVLVAEDNDDIRFLLRAHLKQIGVDFRIENNGFAAVESAMAGNFDLVLMDLEMPVMDGFEATHVLRERGYERPIVAMTAHVEGPQTERARNEGCDAVIAKPLRSEHMERVLREFLVAVPAAGGPSPALLQVPAALTNKYLERCRGDSARLREALDGDRLDAVRDIAHRLRGGGGFFGFDEIARLGAAIEAAAQARESSHVAALLAELGLCIDKEVARRQ